MNFRILVKNGLRCALSLGMVGAFVVSPVVSRGQDLSSGVARAETVGGVDQNSRLLNVSPASYGITTETDSSDNGIYEQYLKGRLQIGTRFMLSGLDACGFREPWKRPRERNVSRFDLCVRRGTELSPQYNLSWHTILTNI